MKIEPSDRVSEGVSDRVSDRVSEGVSESPSSDILARTLSGAVAGLVSRVVSAPLDVLKIRFQLQHSHAPRYTSLTHAVQSITREEGYPGLWKGNIPAVYLWVLYSAVQFSVYGVLQRQCSSAVVRECGEDTSTSASALASVNFLAGAASGVLATAVTYPFDIMRTQFAIQGDKMVHKSMISYVKHTYTHHQFSGFFRGLPAAVVGIVPFMGLNFSIYEFLKSKGQQLQSALALSTSRSGSEEKGASTACLMFISGMAGGLSGGISKLMVYPLDTMKKHMQAQVLSSTFHTHENPSMRMNVTGVSNKSSDGATLRGCFNKIFRKDGFKGFYKGLVPTVTKSVVSTAVTFYVYEGCYILAKFCLSNAES